MILIEILLILGVLFFVFLLIHFVKYVVAMLKIDYRIDERIYQDDAMKNDSDQMLFM